MKNKYLLSVMLTSIEEAVIPKTNSFETEALVKPEDNMAVCSVTRCGIFKAGKRFREAPRRPDHGKIISIHGT